MRILLDECLPRRLKKELPGHEARSNDIDALRPILPRVQEALADLQPGQILRLSA